MKIKKIVSFLSSVYVATLVSPVFATAAGIYVGGQFGQSNLHGTSYTFQTGGTPSTIRVSPSSTGFGGRINLGYNVTPYGAVEMGISHFAPANYNVPETISCGSPSIHEYSIDFLGKGMVPFGPFSVFGKAGLAILRVSRSGSFASNGPVTLCSSGSSGTSPNTTVRPVIGVGASYDLTQNLQADLSFTRITKGSENNNADLIALGISYHFVDKYCGQFLC